MTTEQAITKLQSQGFTPDQIVGILDVMPDLGTGFIEIDDANCEDCSGWDGLERRCDCGNRRVYWSFDYGVAVAETD